MDRHPNLQRPLAPGLIVSDCYIPMLAVCGLLLVAPFAARADNSLPAITVTGKATPTPTPVGDAINRDWTERSPEMHWPTAMFNRSAEVFAHNQIEINASCGAVWDHLVHAELWPTWCPYSGKVKIWGGSQVLQKNTKFSWLSSDVPQLLPILGQVPPDKVDGLVVECDPPYRLGWRSYGRAWTIHGPLVDSYHNWFIKPIGPRKCVVTFEEVATGMASRWERSAYPEFTHLSHDHWLEDLKRISEARK
jgi:hypothetical protein